MAKKLRKINTVYVVGKKSFKKKDEDDWTEDVITVGNHILMKYCGKRSTVSKRKKLQQVKISINRKRHKSSFVIATAKKVNLVTKSKTNSLTTKETDV